MKTKEYVTKYELDKDDRFNHSEFTADLTNEFLSLLEVGKNKEGEINIKGFENAVNCIRMKWSAINNKTVGQLPEKLWSYFYATVVVKMREEMFPEEMQRRKEKAEEWERRKQERKSFYGGGDFYGSIFNRIYADMLFNAAVNLQRQKSDAFTRLGLTMAATEDEVNKAWRTLSLKHHPDKGGDQATFIEITEAKNKCIAFIQRAT